MSQNIYLVLTMMLISVQTLTLTLVPQHQQEIDEFLKSNQEHSMVPGLKFSKQEIKKMFEQYKLKSSLTKAAPNFLFQPSNNAETLGTCNALPVYPLKKIGQECQTNSLFNFFECESPNECKNGKCAEPTYKDIGSRCDIENGICENQIEQNLICINKTCTYLKKESEGCLSNFDCYSKVCQNGKCVDKKLNEQCTSSQQCLYPNLYCDKVCLNRKEIGQSCIESIDSCKVGLSCVNNRCEFRDTTTGCSKRQITELLFIEVLLGLVCYPDDSLRQRFQAKKNEKCLFGFHCSKGLACNKNGICEDAPSVPCSNYTLNYVSMERTGSSCQGAYCDCTKGQPGVCSNLMDPLLSTLTCVYTFNSERANCTSQCGPSANLLDANNCAFKNCKSALDKYICCLRNSYPLNNGFKLAPTGLGDYKFDPNTCSTTSSDFVKTLSAGIVVICILLFGIIA